MSKKNSDIYDINYINPEFFKFRGTPSDIFIFKPNLCLHRAGVPQKNKQRKQMMIQLNPAKNWVYNKSIHKFQKIREPEFPLISYLLDSKEKLI